MKKKKKNHNPSGTKIHTMIKVIMCTHLLFMRRTNLQVDILLVVVLLLHEMQMGFLSTPILRVHQP